jgi:3-isopropylmalate/(R)-2-methylmalate dehydratase small subunit
LRRNFRTDGTIRRLISGPDGNRFVHFELDPFRKRRLLNGLDDIDLTMRHADKIQAYEERRRREEDWVF